MTSLERLYTLAEAAQTVQVTSSDAWNPERWIRDKVRALRLPFLRVGRTVKLPQSTIEALRHSMVRTDQVAESVAIDLPSAARTFGPTTREVLERLEGIKAARKATRQ